MTGISKQTFQALLNQKGFVAPKPSAEPAPQGQEQSAPQFVGDSMTFTSREEPAFDASDFPVASESSFQEESFESSAQPFQSARQHAPQPQPLHPTASLMCPAPAPSGYRGFECWTMPANPTPHDKELQVMVRQTDKEVAVIYQQIAARRHQSAQLHLQTYAQMS